MKQALEGGCLCGDVRYRLRAHGDDMPLCHCSNCRRATGAPAVAWITVPREALDWTGHAPASFSYASDVSPHVRRTFCGRCGSPLTWERVGSHEVDVTVGTLDDPERAQPTRHVFASRQLSWMTVGANLPRDDD